MKAGTFLAVAAIIVPSGLTIFEIVKPSSPKVIVLQPSEQTKDSKRKVDFIEQPSTSPAELIKPKTTPPDEQEVPLRNASLILSGDCYYLDIAATSHDQDFQSGAYLCTSDGQRHYMLKHQSSGPSTVISYNSMTSSGWGNLNTIKPPTKLAFGNFGVYSVKLLRSENFGSYRAFKINFIKL